MVELAFQKRSKQIIAIDIKGLAKTFASKGRGNVRALAPVDLQIEAGSFVAIVGRSGCGKSTLLRLIAGLEKPTAGNLSVKERMVQSVACAMSFKTISNLFSHG